MSEKLNPVTREEMFLAKAAGQNTPELTPITRVERFMQNLIDHIKSIGTGGSGGGGAQSDWNAAEGEPGHVLNRPFYSDYGMKTLLEETTLTISGETEGMAIIPHVVDLTGVPEVEVTYNGTKYVCPVLEQIEETPNGVGKVWMFGNTAVFNPDLGEDTGEPFAAMFCNAIGAEAMGLPGAVAPLDGSTEFTIYIVGNVETAHPIPEKYLPELRAQKKIVIDIDNLSANIPFDTAWAMDIAELQATTTVLYNSIESAAIAVRRQELYQSGIELKRLYISFANIESKDRPLEILTIDWHSVNGETEINFAGGGNRYSIPENNREVNRVWLSQPTAGATSNWTNPSFMEFGWIWLRSGTGKRFKVTVDDNGNLTATAN